MLRGEQRAYAYKSFFALAQAYRCEPTQSKECGHFRCLPSTDTYGRTKITTLGNIRRRCMACTYFRSILLFILLPPGQFNARTPLSYTIQTHPLYLHRARRCRRYSPNTFVCLTSFFCCLVAVRVFVCDKGERRAECGKSAMPMRLYRWHKGNQNPHRIDFDEGTWVGRLVYFILNAELNFQRCRRARNRPMPSCNAREEPVANWPTAR